MNYRLKQKIQTSLTVGLGLGIGNTVLISAITGILSGKHIGFVLLFALLTSLAFAAMFMLATADWDVCFMRIKQLGRAPVRPAPQPRLMPRKLAPRKVTQS